jgi:hypothetical protein
VWITGQDTATGQAALGELFDDWLWSLEPHLELLAIVVEGNRVAAQLHESMTVDGERRDFDIAVFFDVTDGVIARAKVYREGSADL